MENGLPRISVIIPCYNAALYIAATIESVLAQTLPAAEILVVDDGSQDNSLAVLAGFGERVRILTRENGGPAAARNLAIANATGDFIAFLDSDDLWEPEKLARQMAEFSAHPETGLVFSEAIMFREENGERAALQRIGYTGDPTFRQLLFGDYIPNSTVIVRREAIESTGPLNESRELVGAEDYEYWMRIALRHQLRGIPASLAWYRIRPGNLMGAGEDIEKGLRLAQLALEAVEAREQSIWPSIWPSFWPSFWEAHGVDRAQLFARLHLRAGHAWRLRGAWRQWLGHNLAALAHCRQPQTTPRILRWMIAAAVLRRWS
ncbi:MAG: glycosyltransferase [Acidobacteriota bacterium]